jgi:serine/threonine-protein kinase
MLAGSPPFDGSTPEAIMTAHITEDPVTVRDRSELEIPRELGELIMDCLAKNPDERPESVRAVQMTLASIEFKKPWSVERAAAWWDLHLPAESFS